MCKVLVLMKLQVVLLDAIARMVNTQHRLVWYLSAKDEKARNRRMLNGTYGGVGGRKTKVGKNYFVFLLPYFKNKFESLDVLILKHIMLY